MALLASRITGDVGLGLLLRPLGSNIVIRTACCSVGIVLPVYSTLKAIEMKDQDEQQRMLLYWAAYGSFSLVEIFSDKLLSWFPLYYHLKFSFLVWLQLPSANGAKQLYISHLRPFFLRHQSRLDHILGVAYAEMMKLISLHQTEIQYAKAMLVKMMGSVERRSRSSGRPNHEPNRTARAIEGQMRSRSDVESDKDE